MTGRGADVVAQGPEPGAPGRLPPWLGRLALGLVAVLVVLGLFRAGLLSADKSLPRPTPTVLPGPVERTPRLVARLGDRLLLASDGEPLAGSTLPRGLPAGASLVPVRLGDGTPPVAVDGPGPVLGVRRGLLFRADPDRARWRPLGRADAVIAASFSPSRAVVRRGDALEEVEVGSGAQTEPMPFPGFDPGAWTPEGLLAAAGTGALVMSRPAAGGFSVLALAWPSGLVRTGTEPEVEELGTYGPLLGIADDWVITLRPSCPGATCRIRVVSVTRDLVRARDVAPPPGWTFVPGPSAGRTHEALVPVRRLNGGRPDGAPALARLVPGGDNALLVRDTERVVLAAGLADGPLGRVYLLTDPIGGGDPQARVWDPELPAAATLLTPRATFPRTARLVCVCG